jgi:HD-GYP domain-containing protein (c-di-GMP phosphodiesterase class II)
MFMPEAVEVLKGLSLEEEFWFEVFQADVMEYLRLKVDPRTMNLSIADLEELVPVFARIIDYRSHFTATHSSGVAAVAEILARTLGFSEENCRIIRIAGYLHDLGKLAVPTELLEKRSHLDQREYINVQDHVVHTHRLLENVPDLGYGIIWASQHHERMDGSGYPDHSTADEIAFGSRVVAVADIFTAVTEKRPYREGMSRNEALVELKHLTDRGYLDKEVFMAITSNYEVLDTVRREAQAAALDDYRERMTPFLNGADECEGVN